RLQEVRIHAAPGTTARLVHAQAARCLCSIATRHSLPLRPDRLTGDPAARLERGEVRDEPGGGGEARQKCGWKATGNRVPAATCRGHPAAILANALRRHPAPSA